MTDSPFQLVMSGLYQGRKGARPPVANPTSIVCHGLLEATGVPFAQAHRDAEMMAQLALAGHEVAGFDAVMPEFSVDQEAAALGCTIDWGDNDTMPTAKDTPYDDFRDVEVPSDFLERPTVRVVLDALGILRRQVGGRVAVIGKVMGPWTLSYHLAGTQNFLLAVGLEEHDKVRRMLDQLMPVTISFANAQFAAGADAVVIADHITGNLAGPHHYQELLLPYHQIIAREVGGPLILHVCGDCSDRLHLFAQSGFTAYHFEWQTGPQKAVAAVGDKITLFGCVNIPQVLFQGTPEEVHQQTRQAIAAGVDVICPECAIPLSTPLENLQAIVAAAREGY